MARLRVVPARDIGSFVAGRAADAVWSDAFREAPRGPRGERGEANGACAPDGRGGQSPAAIWYTSSLRMAMAKPAMRTMMAAGTAVATDSGASGPTVDD